MALGVVAPMLGSSPANAQLERPKRQPDGGGLLDVDLSIRYSQTDLKTGEVSGEIWFEPSSGKKYRGSCDITVETERGERSMGDFTIELDADYDARGAEEPPAGPLDVDLLARPVASSDLSLIPIRLLIPHRMSYEGSSRDAVKEVQCIGATVEMTETRLGSRRIENVPHETYFTSIVRRFQPSGYQIHDYILTAEDNDQGFIMGGVGLRMVIHPTLPVEGGRRAPSGVLLVAMLRVGQLKWINGAEQLPAQDASWLSDRFGQSVTNALFDAMQREGIGDLFDSPSAFAMAELGILDQRTLERLIKIGHPKPLAMLVPQIVDQRVQFDGATHKKLWKDCDDPVRRLLLAAGAEAGGASDAEFAHELKLAARSSDPSVLRAAKVLAKALGDLSAQSEIDKKLGG